MSNISSAALKIDPDNNDTYNNPFYFIINNLLYSRLETNYPTNTKYFDEDVNLYLAKLLTSFMNPEYHNDLCKYVMHYDIQLFETIRNIDTPRPKYKVYKYNADYLLVMSGIFDNPNGRRPDSNIYYSFNKESYIGRGKAYYNIASSYLVEATRTRSAVSHMLEKLSDGFEEYIRILSYMRGEYLNIFKRISSGEIYHFQNSLSPEGERLRSGELYDEFLDIYSEHRRNPSDETDMKLSRIVRKIRKVDPGFKFEISR